MRSQTIVILGMLIMAFGVVLANASAAVQQSGVPGAGLAAAFLGLASLLSIACPACIGATWVVDRIQQGRHRRTGCM